MGKDNSEVFVMISGLAYDTDKEILPEGHTMQNETRFLLILATGVFGILNTEMGMIGILPYMAEHFRVTISEAGLLVSLFALVVAIAGPTMPLVFSRFNRQTVMLAVAIFVGGNLIAAYTTNFTVALFARVVPAFFHPVYCSLAFVATLLWVPSLPVTERLSYGAQVQVLKRGDVWMAIVAVVFMNSAVFGVFSYLADYLGTVARIPATFISPLLFAYGAANVVGSYLSGQLLMWNALTAIRAFPVILALLYVFLYFAGDVRLVALLILLWGLVGGVNANMNQFWITRAAPEAKTFANGLFLTAANVGTMLGTMLGGWIIAAFGMAAVVFGGIAFAAASLLCLRTRGA